MTCPAGFPKRSMDGCCRWTSAPSVCSKKKLQNSTGQVDTSACMETLCQRGKGSWSLYRPDPAGKVVMNVCCNKRLASLQPHIKGDSGISPGSKSIVTRVSMDALDSTNGDPTNSKEI